MSAIMDPTLLSEVERHEEYLIRGIKTRGEGGLQQLNSFLNSEASGLKHLPVPLPTMNPVVEIKLIRDLFVNFAALMEEYSKTKDASLAKVLMTKFLHLSGRVNRLAGFANVEEDYLRLVEQLSSLRRFYDILISTMEILGDPNALHPQPPFSRGGIPRTPDPPRISSLVSENEADYVHALDSSSRSLDASVSTQGLACAAVSGADVMTNQTLVSTAPNVPGTSNLSHGIDQMFDLVDTVSTTQAVIRNSVGSVSARSIASSLTPMSQAGYSIGQLWGFQPVSTQNSIISSISDKAKKNPSLVQHGGIRFSAPSHLIPRAFRQSNSIPQQYDLSNNILTSNFRPAQIGAPNLTYLPQLNSSSDSLGGNLADAGFCHVSYAQTGISSSSGSPITSQSYASRFSAQHGSQPVFSSAFQQAQPNIQYSSAPRMSAYSIPSQFDAHQLPHFQNNQSAFSANNLPDPTRSQWNASASSGPPHPGRSIGDPNRAPQNNSRSGFTNQMAKWNLRFCGNDKDVGVDDFLFRAETLARSANIGLEVLPLGMHYLLHEDALDWFWDYHRNNPFSSWPEFVDAMRHQYSSTDTDLEIYDKIRSRKQRPGETFAKFSVAISLIASRLCTPLSEAERLEHLRANMCVGLKNALLFHPTRSVHQLQDLAKKYEKLSMNQTDTARPISRRVSELEALTDTSCYLGNTALTQSVEPSYSDHDAIEAVSSPSTPAANRAEFMCCWNCDEMGHTYVDCVVATRNVFCYGCGAKNTYRPNCAKCKTGNLRQGGTSQQPARPTQILPRAPNPFARRQSPI